ncbi:hypothetical protein UFOVP263_28 [uncultured Caudovirales phage]|uniref:Uncharacterized protein n=1 Tax=uncultured Caudovirales phage TaxID=2100421 RepID=A0A6J5LGY9_9CAUD|nr:hypothetical protein UFOVP263_28 [uncultured Caudovirales phage]CAB4242069.1 hypothetical protein UFOVP91_35 [uncultured Caudovirales phage]
MSDQKYNGWTNYATWRINLEIFDGMTSRDFLNTEDVYDLSKVLEAYVEEVIGEYAKGLGFDYALAFIHQANFYEIASFMIASDCEELDALNSNGGIDNE